MSKLKSQCIFCNKTNCKIIYSSKYFFVIRDTAYPVTKHHTLIVTHRHVSNYFSLTNKEIYNLNNILKNQKKKLLRLDKNI